MKIILVALLCAATASCGKNGGPANHSAVDRSIPLLSVCELMGKLESYQNKMVAVRGVYYFGLREESCATPFVAEGRKWPIVLDFADAEDNEEGDPRVGFSTDRRTVDAIDMICLQAGREHRRQEIWATVVGQVRGPRRHDPYGRPLGLGGYGHLGGFAAKLVIQRVQDVQVKQIPTYDYSKLLKQHP